MKAIWVEVDFDVAWTGKSIDSIERVADSLVGGRSWRWGTDGDGSGPTGLDLTHGVRSDGRICPSCLILRRGVGPEVVFGPIGIDSLARSGSGFVRVAIQGVVW